MGQDRLPGSYSAAARASVFCAVCAIVLSAGGDARAELLGDTGYSVALGTGASDFGLAALEGTVSGDYGGLGGGVRLDLRRSTQVVWEADVDIPTRRYSALLGIAIRVSSEGFTASREWQDRFYFYGEAGMGFGVADAVGGIVARGELWVGAGISVRVPVGDRSVGIEFRALRSDKRQPDFLERTVFYGGLSWNIHRT